MHKIILRFTCILLPQSHHPNSFKIPSLYKASPLTAPSSPSTTTIFTKTDSVPHTNTSESAQNEQQVSMSYVLSSDHSPHPHSTPPQTFRNSKFLFRASVLKFVSVFLCFHSPTLSRIHFITRLITPAHTKHRQQRDLTRTAAHALHPSLACFFYLVCRITQSVAVSISHSNNHADTLLYLNYTISCLPFYFYFCIILSFQF